MSTEIKQYDFDKFGPLVPSDGQVDHRNRAVTFQKEVRDQLVGQILGSVFHTEHLKPEILKGLSSADELEVGKALFSVFGFERKMCILRDGKGDQPKSKQQKPKPAPQAPQSQPLTETELRSAERIRDLVGLPHEIRVNLSVVHNPRRVRQGLVEGEAWLREQANTRRTAEAESKMGSAHLQANQLVEWLYCHPKAGEYLGEIWAVVERLMKATTPNQIDRVIRAGDKLAYQMAGIPLATVVPITKPVAEAKPPKRHTKSKDARKRKGKKATG